MSLTVLMGLVYLVDMTNGYAKVFSTILASSVWTYDDQTRLVWITMLVLMDMEGNVRGSIPGLAHFARVPLESCKRALETFLSPDPDSASKGHDGRRIKEIDGGWNILNSEKYRDMMSLEERQAYWRRQKAKSRAKFKEANEDLTIRHLAHKKQAVEDKLNPAMQ